MKLKSSIIFLILLTIFSFELSSQITSNNKLIKPKYLTPGDTVAIVAPSGVLKNYNNYISKAKELLNWSPRRSLEAMCKDGWKWYRKIKN